MLRRCDERGVMGPPARQRRNSDEKLGKRIRVLYNLDMINALIAVGLSFLNPAVAFVFLFTKAPAFVIAGLVFARSSRRRSSK